MLTKTGLFFSPHMLRIWAEILVFFFPLSTHHFFPNSTKNLLGLVQVFCLSDFCVCTFRFSFGFVLFRFWRVIVTDHSPRHSFICLTSVCGVHALCPGERSASPFIVLCGWETCLYLQ